MGVGAPPAAAPSHTQRPAPTATGRTRPNVPPHPRATHLRPPLQFRGLAPTRCEPHCVSHRHLGRPLWSSDPPTASPAALEPPAPPPLRFHCIRSSTSLGCMGMHAPPLRDRQTDNVHRTAGRLTLSHNAIPQGLQAQSSHVHITLAHRTRPVSLGGRWGCALLTPSGVWRGEGGRGGFLRLKLGPDGGC